METNGILTAPQINDVAAVYAVWKEDHAGGLGTFYEFMTAPTIERDRFIASLRTTVEFSGQTVSEIITPGRL